jgi:ribosome-dependent ATPase
VKGSIATLFLGGLYLPVRLNRIRPPDLRFHQDSGRRDFCGCGPYHPARPELAGLIVPVSSPSGAAQAIGLGFPGGWFQQVSIGAFTKGLGFAALWFDILVLAAFAISYVAAAILLLRKQDV